MEKFYDRVIRYRKGILIVFLLIFLFSGLCQSMVSVNYDMNEYLPKDSPSTVAIDVMQEEFVGGIPNMRVMIGGLNLPEALEYKQKIREIDGVSAVTWLDDAIDIRKPLEVQDEDVIAAYYKDGEALYTVTVDEDKAISTVEKVRNLIGDENAITGSAVSTALAISSTVKEISRIAVISVLFVLIVLVITTTSWMEPVIVLIGLGVAIVINAGTNLIFGEISFVTNAAGNILQLAVSLDYSVFLIHRFEEYRHKETPEEAMGHALCASTSTILSSGLTTVIGFFALTLMRFGIGSDLGFALAKGIAISLITVFLFMPGLILGMYKWMDRTRHASFLPRFHALGRGIVRVMIPLAVVFVLLIVPSYLASERNEYYYGGSYIFGPETRLGSDTNAVQKVFGKSSTYVLMVQKGDLEAEKKLCEKLKELPEVTSVISYVGLAGAQIPYEYLDEETLKQLESENYSRMVLSVDTDSEGKEAFALIEKIREIAAEEYQENYYLAGDGVSTYDLMDTVTVDMVKVNFIAVGSVLVVLVLTLKSIVLPIILVLTIETAIWINFSIPYYMDQPLFYIAYLIISSVQLGATVDYAILFASRYRENRTVLGKKESILETVINVTASILTSGIVMTTVGFLLGVFSTHGLLSQLGYLLGKGTVCSLLAVLFVLPGFLYLFDGIFYRGRKHQSGKISKEEVN